MNETIFLRMQSLPSLIYELKVLNSMDCCSGFLFHLNINTFNGNGIIGTVVVDEVILSLYCPKMRSLPVLAEMLFSRKSPSLAVAVSMCVAAVGTVGMGLYLGQSVAGRAIKEEGARCNEHLDTSNGEYYCANIGKCLESA